MWEPPWSPRAFQNVWAYSSKTASKSRKSLRCTNLGDTFQRRMQKLTEVSYRRGAAVADPLICVRGRPLPLFTPLPFPSCLLIPYHSFPSPFPPFPYSLIFSLALEKVPLKPARRAGECCKRSPDRKRIWCTLKPSESHWWQSFSVSWSGFFFTKLDVGWGAWRGVAGFCGCFDPLPLCTPLYVLWRSVDACRRKSRCDLTRVCRRVRWLKWLVTLINAKPVESARRRTAET